VWPFMGRRIDAMTLQDPSAGRPRTVVDACE